MWDCICVSVYVGCHTLTTPLPPSQQCCNHPYLFTGVEDRTLDPLGDHVVTNCGKMFLLDKLLKKLKEKGHRVLVFCQVGVWCACEKEVGWLRVHVCICLLVHAGSLDVPIISPNSSNPAIQQLQMTRMLDILEDFMVMRGHAYCRIDGNTSYEERENLIDTCVREPWMMDGGWMVVYTWMSVGGLRP